MADEWAAFRTAPAASTDEWAAFRPTAPVAAAPEPIAAPTPVYRGTLLPFEAMSDGSKRLAVPGIISDTIDSLRLPEKVASGEINPMSDQATEQMLGLAGLVVGGGIPSPTRGLVTGAGKAVPDAVTSALRADGVPLGEVAARVRGLGPAGTVADLGPNARYKAAALATRPGSAQTTVVDAMRARQRGAPERLTGSLNDTLGPAKIPSYLKTEIEDNMRAVGPEYDAALAGAAPVNTTTLADGLDAGAAVVRGDAQTKLNSVRGMLNDAADSKVLSSDPAVLHQTRQAIDGMLDGEQDGNVKRVLTQARQEIDGLLSGAVPEIKTIDSKYAELGSQKRAVKDGQLVLESGRESPRPQELADTVAEGVMPKGLSVGPSGVAFRLSQGARAEIDRLVGTNLNDRAALNKALKGESDWNYSRLSTLFGKEKVDQLYKILGNERDMAETENMALANSKTAGVQAAQQEISGPGTREKSAFRSAGNLNFGDAAARVLDKATGGYSTYKRDTLNQDIADVLMGRGDLSPTVTTAAGMNKTGGVLGSLIDAIMQSGAAPAPGSVQPGQRPISEEEYRQLIMQGLGT